MADPDTESDKLIVRQAMHDPTLFTPLYQKYLLPVYKYVFSKVFDAPVAEDITSQTFMTALQSLPALRQPERFSSWLFSIAHNKTMDWFRQQKHQVPLEQESEDKLIASDVNPLSDEVIWLRKTISGLDKTDQEILRFRFVANLTFSETAGVMKSTENKVKKRYYHLIEYLRNLMEVDHD